MVGVDRELGPEGRHRPREVVPLLVHQALAVQEVDERHPGVRVERLADLRHRLGAVLVPRVHHREEDVGLGRAVAEDAIDRGLRLDGAALGEKRHAEQVRHRAIRRGAPGQRLQDLDHAGALAEAEEAVGEEQRRRLVLRLRREDLLRLGRGLRQAPGLVEGERQVAADRDVARRPWRAPGRTARPRPRSGRDPRRPPRGSSGARGCRPPARAPARTGPPHPRRRPSGAGRRHWRGGRRGRPAPPPRGRAPAPKPWAEGRPGERAESTGEDGSCDVGLRSARSLDSIIGRRCRLVG